jgi:DNA-binding MarR family transcriptional regulator
LKVWGKITIASIIFISENEGCTLSEVIRHLKVGYKKVRDLYINLEENGYIENRNAEKPWRVTYCIELTHKGRRLLGRIRRFELAIDAYNDYSVNVNTNDWRRITHNKCGIFYSSNRTKICIQCGQVINMDKNFCKDCSRKMKRITSCPTEVQKIIRNQTLELIMGIDEERQQELNEFWGFV